MDNNLSELTAPQQHRYFALKAIYGSEDAFKIAKVLNDRGRNSFGSFIEKMAIWLAPMSDEDLEFFNELLLVFPLGNPVNTNGIIEKVTLTQLKLGRPLFRSKPKQECEKLFFKLFAVEDIVEEVMMNGSKVTQVAGYIPLAWTKPRQQR